MSLPRAILDRVSRVADYHLASNLASPVRAPGPRVSIWTSFDFLPKTRLPADLIDAPSSMVRVLQDGLAAIPESLLHPPQDLRTLATWLYLAYGRRDFTRPGETPVTGRACPSDEGCYPCEIYVAAFRVRDLEPGLYHFSGRDFSLAKMRDGGETLRQLKKGRPDLNFLSDTPAAVLVSTLFARSSAVLRKRAYRSAVRDAGCLVQNLVTVATGLGISTMVRQKLNDQTTRELIGLPVDVPYDDAEAVHALVAWTDQASDAMPIPKAAPTDTSLESIPRERATTDGVAYGSVISVHLDCVAPGVAARDVRPPLTELSPLSSTFPIHDVPMYQDLPLGRNVREVLLDQRPPAVIGRGSISRDIFVGINHIAFRGGSHYPLFPAGAHVGLIRPFWLVRDISGLDSGIWHFNPISGAFSILLRGEFQDEMQKLCRHRQTFASAAAVCMLTANLSKLLQTAGPDLYRLAHLEAGVVTQRINLSSGGWDLACESIGDFCDEALRRFLGLDQTGWDCVGLVAVGHRDEDA